MSWSKLGRAGRVGERGCVSGIVTFKHACQATYLLVRITAVGHGPNGASACQVWQDMRTNTKAKIAKIVKDRNETGGGIPAASDTLTNEENAVLRLMSPILWSGIGQGSESAVEGSTTPGKRCFS
ncbi:hypothetical protein CBL_10632 [Carabus blaptoides fortunei]